ncbi:MAG: ArsR/SmtB family transcription factor [Candidatus Hodarchaeota archaeon]
MDNINKKRTLEIIGSLESCIDMKKIDVNTYFQNLQDFGKNLDNFDNFEKILEFCYALGNKERLKIVTALKNNDHCVCELEAILDKSQPSISHHLRILESVGLIRSFKKGKFTHYDLVNEQFEFYIKLLNQELGLEVFYQNY